MMNSCGVFGLSLFYVFSSSVWFLCGLIVFSVMKNGCVRFSVGRFEVLGVVSWVLMGVVIIGIFGKVSVFC